MNRFTVLFSIMVTLSGLLGCKKDVPPSVVLIVTEKMNSLDLNCAGNDEEASNGGFPTLCREFIRFTHAYTASTQTVPGFTSLLTGAFPLEHRVRNNGQSLSHLRTIAETALTKGYRTAFFSGGAPILHKTGLHRGFEIFDDSLGNEESVFFKPFRVSIERFKTWFEREVNKDAFFVVFYVPDLSFIDRVTQDQFGVSRNRTFESQLEEFDDTLGEFFNYLKARDKWDGTQIIFTSLNGRNVFGRSDEFDQLNLHSEFTQVPLFIKSAQKKRDEPITWKVDQNLSLVDVGVTLFSQMSENLEGFKNSKLQRISLLPVLQGPGSLNEDNRIIPIESGWGVNWGLWGIRAAYIHGFDLLMWNRQPLLFNTLLDRLELNAQKASLDSLPENFRELVGYYGAESWFTDKNVKDFLQIQEMLSMGDSDKLEKKIKSVPENSLVRENGEKNWAIDFLLQEAFRKKDWKKLANLSQLFNRPLLNSYALALAGGNDEKLLFQPCYRLFKKKNLRTAPGSDCRDKMVLDLIRWVQKNESANSFITSYRNLVKERNFILRNLSLEQVWDMSPNLRLAPQETELILALPENTNFQHDLLQIMSTKSPLIQELSDY